MSGAGEGRPEADWGPGGISPSMEGTCPKLNSAKFTQNSPGAGGAAPRPR